MIGLIVTSIILMLIMLIFVVILFNNIIKKIDDNAKAYFVNKMQNYDYILEEKQENLKELNDKIEEIKSENANILNHADRTDFKDLFQDNSSANGKNKGSKGEVQTKILLNIPEYRDATNFFSNYKKIKQLFTVNNEQIIKNFVQKNKNIKEEKLYNKLKKIREKFDNDAIYACMTLKSEDQLKVLDESLTDSEKKSIDFDKIKNNKDFNLGDFINKLDNNLVDIDPTIYVYVNSPNLNYDYIDKNIVTKQYKNMAEGIIVEYKNKIYDYSI